MSLESQQWRRWRDMFSVARLLTHIIEMASAAVFSVVNRCSTDHSHWGQWVRIVVRCWVQGVCQPAVQCRGTWLTDCRCERHGSQDEMTAFQSRLSVTMRRTGPPCDHSTRQRLSPHQAPHSVWNLKPMTHLKFSFESHFLKPLSKENFQMWHTDLHKFLLAKVNFRKQNELYSWKFSFVNDALWQASQSHKTVVPTKCHF